MLEVGKAGNSYRFHIRYAIFGIIPIFTDSVVDVDFIYKTMATRGNYTQGAHVDNIDDLCIDKKIEIFILITQQLSLL